MIAAKHDFDRYNGEMNVYLDCLNLEMDATPKDPTKMTRGREEKGGPGTEGSGAETQRRRR